MLQGQPKVHEQTFNIGLAQAVRRRKPSWSEKDVDVVQDERLQALAESAGRPDILIGDPLAPPLVIEVSHSGRDAELDARKRLGQELSSDSLRIQAAIAVVIPQEFGAPGVPGKSRRLYCGGFRCNMPFCTGSRERRPGVGRQRTLCEEISTTLPLSFQLSGNRTSRSPSFRNSSCAWCGAAPCESRTDS